MLAAGLKLEGIDYWLLEAAQCDSSWKLHGVAGEDSSGMQKQDTGTKIVGERRRTA